MASPGGIVAFMDDLSPLEPPMLSRARLSRDARFDGKFFVAVSSTGIYCRPICPAPSPKERNVRYFLTAAAAAEAGFRPCLRCRPEAAPGTPAWLGTSAVVRRALRLIEEGALDESTVAAFATRVGIGARHLDRLFLKHVGASPIAVAQTRRLHFAKRLIDESNLPMTEVALASGFASLRRFNAAFREAYARSPRELRQLRRDAPPLGGKDDVTLTLSYRPPYDWAHLRHFLALRAIPGVEHVDEDSYARLVRLDGGHAVIDVRQVPERNALQLRVRGAPPGTLFQLACAARRVFDLSADPALVATGFATDPQLRSLVRHRPGVRIPGTWDPFECAVRAVLGQQVTVAAARTLAMRVVSRLGEPISTATPGLTHLFPAPAAIASGNLAGLGLTGARISAVKALARAVLDGRVAFDRPAAEVVESLIALPGVGEWTAQYIALRALGEPDAFLSADVVVRRVAAAGKAPLSARELIRRAESWRPWRGYAVMHLWCAASKRVSP
jgi:AraC family transcriptional regulator of adaptative response / DNA-3-methyladenine glycosylase II